MVLSNPRVMKAPSTLLREQSAGLHGLFLTIQCLPRNRPITQARVEYTGRK